MAKPLEFHVAQVSGALVLQIATLSAQADALSDENAALKAQVADLTKQIADLKIA